MNDSQIISKFNLIKYGEENIDAVYRSNLLLYKYELSDIKHIPKDDFNFEDGILRSKVALACYTSGGFHIDERHFQEAELQMLEKVDINELSYGDKEKYNAYVDYIRLKIKYREWFYIKNRNGFYALKRSKLPKFKKAIYSGYFKGLSKRTNEDGSKNEFHFAKRIYDWKDQRDELLRENAALHPRLKLLIFYNAILRSLLDDTLQLFVIVEKYDGSEIAYINNFNMKHFDIVQTLKTVGNFSQNINHNINTGHYKIALEMQHYCLLIFDDIIGVLYSLFFIDIWKSPLAKKFKEVENQLRNAIDMDKLDLLLRVGGVSKESSEKDSDFTFTDTDKNFKSIEGKLIFEKFHSYYRNQTELSKNYSFLWYAFKKDNYTDLSQKKWITFIKSIGIICTFSTRDKFDYEQNGQLRDTYSSYKKEVQEASN